LNCRYRSWVRWRSSFRQSSDAHTECQSCSSGVSYWFCTVSTWWMYITYCRKIATL